MPSATRIAVLVNPANATNVETTLKEIGLAGRAIGIQAKILNASTICEINEAFATFVHERPDAVFMILDAEDLGRGRAAKGHALSLSQPAQSSDPVDRRRPLASQDRRADFHPGCDDQNDHPPHAWRGNGKDD